MFTHIVQLPRKIKILIMLLCDVILLPLAFWTAIAMRLGTTSPDTSNYEILFVLIVLFTIPIFVRIGLYRSVIRYVDDKIIYTILLGVSLSVLLLTAAVTMGRFITVPRSAILIYWFMATTYITISRYFARGIIRKLEPSEDRRDRIAIFGAGRAGMQTALALFSSKEFLPVAFFDDNVQLQGSTIAGIRVYSPEDALKVIHKKSIKQVLLALPQVSRTRRKEIIQLFDGHNLNLKTIPSFQELISGQVRVEDIRDVGIEDLLGRDIVPPDEKLIQLCVKGKNVLVTGAGGSIGSELCRQILKQTPEILVLVEMNEFALYRIHQELTRLFPYIKIKPVLGNVVNKEQMNRTVKEYSIHTIYHAAAYKHVPLVEENISQSILNNVMGTWSMIQAALANSVQHFVLISTDKAVRPTNVMGATKRLAELTIQMYAKKGEASTKLSMVRFGNVLGSSGSVVPLFKEQIKAGGPVTVTHPEVTRFFMTIPEAAQLVMQAGAMAEQGDVFVLDMGESVKIVDLAVKMINLSGFEVVNNETGRGDIAIEYVGLRPGEKLYEELLIGNNTSQTNHPRIMKAQENFLEYSYLKDKLEELQKLCMVNDTASILKLVKTLVPEYQMAEHHNSSKN
ncbi:polysaccharide biosynthesis protein [bacterium]|nr:polysaccharide biosynthesis protein [bacterium]